MAHNIQLSLGGSTINLNSGSILLRHYVPEEPNLSTIDSNTILQDGGRRTLSTRRNVTENCNILVKATSGCASDLEATKHKIQKWLLSAEDYQETGTGSKVYVQYAPDGLSGSIYRSELLGGKVSVIDNSLDTRWTVNRAVELGIAWSRNYFWEGSELTLTLFNSGCTSSCATIKNQNPQDFSGQSGCWNNWVQIAGSDIVGEIDSPATIEIHNQSGYALDQPAYHIFHGYDGDVASFPSYIDSSAGTWSGASNLSSASAVSGSYRGRKINAVALWSTFAYFDLPSASLSKWAGQHCNVMGVFYTEPSTSASAVFRVKTTDDQVSGLISIEEGKAVELSSLYELQNIGILRLPRTTNQSGTGVADERMYIQYKNYGASANLYFDGIHIFPSNAYRYIKQNGFQQSDGDYIIDMGDINEVLYSDAADGNKYPIMSWRGLPVRLSPGKNQRIYFLQEEDSRYDIDVVHGIKVKYRPRRLSI